MKNGLKNKSQYAEQGGVISGPLWLDFLALKRVPGFEWMK